MLSLAPLGPLTGLALAGIAATRVSIGAGDRVSGGGVAFEGAW